MFISTEQHLLEEEGEDAILHLIPVPIRIIKQWRKKKERGQRENKNKKNNNNCTKEEHNAFTGCCNILLKTREWEGGRCIEMEINDLLRNVQFSYQCLLLKVLAHEKLVPQLLWPVGTLEIKVNWAEK